METFTPRPWQYPMIEHMLQHPRCAVWAGMGTGKTSATLTALKAMSLVNTDPVLILAPLRVAKNTWPSETKKWREFKDMHVLPIIGSEAERRLSIRYDAPIYSCNYDNLEWLVDYWGDRWPYRTVISDESTRLKNFRTKQGGVRARALAQITHTKVDHFIELTGTPSPNGLKDLWGQMWFLDAGQRLGRTYQAFDERWFAYKRKKDAAKPTPQVQTVIMPFAQEQIHGLVRDLCLTVDLADYVDVAKPITTPVFVDLPPKARRQYDEMERDMFTEIEQHGLEAFNAAARTMKCLQLASGSVWIDRDQKLYADVHTAKLDALESIVEEANGMPVLVRYHWVPSLKQILKRFPQARQLDASQQTEDDWNAGKIPILVAHAASAGHGLNLQHGGNIMAVYDDWWDLEQDMQILERIGPVRQMQSGYNRPVFIYRIIARDTCDELVMARRETKKEVQDLLLEAMKRRRK